MADVWEQARKDYPIIESLGLQFKNSPGGGKGYLEFWPEGEGGTKESPRPKEFDLKKPGVEVYDPKTTASDVMADIASHHLVNTDPVVSKAYKDLQASMTDDQKKVLKEQYEWAKKNGGEKRSYEDWKRVSGLPAWFRGYAFKQWPDDFNKKFYTDDQRKSLDKVVEYLKQPIAKENAPTLPPQMLSPMSELDRNIQLLKTLQ